MTTNCYTCIFINDIRPIFYIIFTSGELVSITLVTDWKVGVGKTTYIWFWYWATIFWALIIGITILACGIQACAWRRYRRQALGEGTEDKLVEDKLGETNWGCTEDKLGEGKSSKDEHMGTPGEYCSFLQGEQCYCYKLVIAEPSAR